jgi:3-oxoacyl-[acyl-carrier-protein] synthase III
MPDLKFNNLKISSISACVPKKSVPNTVENTTLFTKEELAKFVDSTGVADRRYTDKNICSSDLCFYAAKNLIVENNVNTDEIDLLIFVSQTADYLSPATSMSLQHRLGLSKKTAAFDVNLGCTGYIYGLSIAYSIMMQPAFRKCLLLVGDTPSKVVSFKDKTNAYLFGDAGTATLIEKSADQTPAFFSLYSDGERADSIKIEAGGYRLPSSYETLKEKRFPDDSVRNEHQVHMDGMEVFNFTMQEVPKSIKSLLNYAVLGIADIDHMIFHQANKFIIEFLAKKVNFPLDKVRYSISEFGNTSSASIPLTIVTRYCNDFDKKTVLLSAFGVGLSWANTVLKIDSCKILPLIEV